MLHKRYKQTLSLTDYDAFRKVREECKRVAQQCQVEYNSKIEASIPLNIKAFWSHINSLKRTPNIPQRMFLDMTEALDSPSKSELFANHFASVFSSVDVPAQSYNFGCNSSISDCHISATDIQQRLQAVDSRKGAGTDGIPPIVINFCASILAPHLAILFRALLCAGIFPSALKKSYIVPIFKSGDRENVKNYRPIAIQPTIAKVFESIVLEHLNFHFKPLLSVEQHGFLQGRSTVTNLLQLEEFIAAAFVDGCQVDCVYLDFAKAFDRVNHRILVAKLEGYGVCGALLKWLKSYLENREYVIKCDGSTSRPFAVKSGVPQGSHLGPLLFNIFINDIGDVISTNFSMFADDMKVYSRIHSILDHDALQLSLYCINDWCKSNAMTLNANKCQVISFSRRINPFAYDYRVDGAILKRVDSIRDLGVIFTSTLSPFEHISNISSKANALIGFIMRSTRQFQSPQTLVTLYKSLVRPLLEYCSVVWTPHQLGHQELLNGVQTRFVRLLGTRMGFSYLGTPVAIVESEFGLDRLSLRRKYADLVILFKLVNGILDCPSLLSCVDLTVPRGTRSRAVFQRRFMPTDYSYNIGITRLLRTGSVVASQVDFFDIGVSSFKIQIAKALASVT